MEAVLLSFHCSASYSLDHAGGEQKISLHDQNQVLSNLREADGSNPKQSRSVLLASNARGLAVAVQGICKAGLRA